MKAVIANMLVCLLLTQSANAQVSIPTKLLAPSSTRNVLAPPFTFWGNPACDKDGNMYFHVGGSSSIEILRLSADGSEGKIFKLPDQFPRAVFSDFSVSPGGYVYVLAGIEGKLKLLRFDEVGAMSEPISFQLPQSVGASNIVASDNRTVLFFGFYDDTAPPDLTGKSYLALINPLSGAVQQEVHVSVPGVDIEKLAARKVPAPGVALGDDGNFYFAGSSQILVITPFGVLVQRIPFDNPSPKSIVTRLLVAGGLIVVVLTRIDNHQAHKGYLVLLNSGGVVGYYEPSAELGGWGAMCFSPREGMKFLKVENRQLKLLTAPFR